jgi:uncharacterized protein (DUF433 family)
MPARKPRPERSVERQSASAYFLSQWRGKLTLVEIPHPRDITPPVSRKPRAERDSIRERFRQLAAKVCSEHPLISVDKEVLSGTPHIKGTRLSVRTILAKLYLYGSVQAVVDIYEPHLSEEQVKEAIAYAQDLLELACGTKEPQVNG